MCPNLSDQSGSARTTVAGGTRPRRTAGFAASGFHPLAVGIRQPLRSPVRSEQPRAGNRAKPRSSQRRRSDAQIPARCPSLRRVRRRRAGCRSVLEAFLLWICCCSHLSANGHRARRFDTVRSPRGAQRGEPSSCGHSSRLGRARSNRSGGSDAPANLLPEHRLSRLCSAASR